MASASGVEDMAVDGTPEPTSVAGTKRNHRKSSALPPPKKPRTEAGQPVLESRWTKVEDQQLLRELRTLVYSKVFPDEVRHGTKMPGPLPKNLTRAGLSVFRKHLFWVCEKSDGLRYMLLVRKDACYLVDRTFDFFRVKDSEVYLSMGKDGDTLLDGELVAETSEDPLTQNMFAPVGEPGQRQAYLTYDCVEFNGTNIVNKNFGKRLGGDGVFGAVSKYNEALAPLIPKQSSATTASNAGSVSNVSTENKDNTDSKETKESKAPQPERPTRVLPFHVQAKKFYHHYDVNYVLDKIKVENGEYVFRETRRQQGQQTLVGRSNKNDGLVFTPDKQGYIQDDPPIYKFKWTDKCSIDFMIRPLNVSSAAQVDKLDLFIGSENNSVTKCRTIPTPYNFDAFFRHSTADQRSRECVIELVYDKKRGQWKYLAFRPEKNKPNYIEVMVSTLEAALDDMKPQDLIEACVVPDGTERVK